MTNIKKYMKSQNDAWKVKVKILLKRLSFFFKNYSKALKKK